MIVDRVMRYLEQADGSVNETVLSAAKEAVARSLLRNLTSDSSKEQHEPSIRPSGPWHCPRRYYYNLTSAATAPMAPRSRLAFLLGDMVEAVAVMLMRLAGVPLLTPLEDGTQSEVSAVISGVPMKGHLDASLSYDGSEVPIDVKSMSKYSFQSFKQACSNSKAQWWSSERFGYIFQLRFYMRMLKEMGRGDGQHGIILGVSKETGHLAELWVPANDDDALIDRAVASVSSAMQSGELPERPIWAKSIEMPGANKLPDGEKGPCLQIDTDRKRTHDHGWRCSYCPFTETCWPGFGLVPLSSGPVYRKPLKAEQAEVAGKA